jgi:glutathione synthase/RimK-type ligase-like ATP-grasp enzyme
VRSTWDYEDKHREFLEWARRVERKTTLWNPAETIAWNSDKRYLRELARRGVPTVPTAWVEPGSGIDLEEVLARRGWAEAVVKPAVDLGARNLRRVRAGGADDALEAVLRRGEAMVQPFLPSLEEEGELSLVFIAGELTHAVRKRPAAGDFRVQSTWGGTARREEPARRERELAARALADLRPAPLYARVDLVRDLAGDPVLIELELIEPNLYLRENPAAADALAAAAAARLR